MTGEELKKEAEEKAGIYFDSLDYDHGDVSDTPFSAYDVFVAYKKGALDFAEPREKQIQIDAKQIRALQKQNGELTDKVTELEAQIEKMKCCQNCLHLCARCELGIDGCYVCSKWELRR